MEMESSAAGFLMGVLVSAMNKEDEKKNFLSR